MGRPKISAYMIIYNDWDILDQAIVSARSFADELVVVDGAYEWMVPFLERYAQNPKQSNEETMSILENHRDFVNYIPGIWLNETSKRIAGYEACSGDIVHLIDADEIHKVELSTIEEFYANARPVGEMPSPLIMPKKRFAILKNRTEIGKKPTTFKKAQISTRSHLSYLWLILPDNERALIPNRIPHSVWQQSIGTNYHYSMLRTPQSAINRALFYVFQKYLSPDAIDTPNNAVSKALSGSIDAGSVISAMRGSSITISFPMNADQIFLPLDLPKDVYQKTEEIEYKASKSLIEHRSQASGRVLLNQVPSYVDISDLRGDGRDIFGNIEIADNALSIQISVVDRTEGDVSYSKTTIASARDSRSLNFYIPAEGNPASLVRCMVIILVKLPESTLATSISGLNFSNSH